MTMLIIKWLKQQFAQNAPKKYQIIHDPELGYAAARRCSILDRWEVIDPHGLASVGVDQAASPVWGELWVSTQEEAGQRINMHATSRGQKAVWSA